jgi:hypothetical protein
MRPGERWSNSSPSLALKTGVSFDLMFGGLENTSEGAGDMSIRGNSIGEIRQLVPLMS